MASPRLILPLRGVFQYHVHRQAFIADANAVFLLDGADVCRVSHPIDGGDACLVLVPEATLLEDALAGWLDRGVSAPGFRIKRLPSSPRIQLALRALDASLPEPSASLLVEEAAMHLLAGIAVGRDQATFIGMKQVRQVQAHLAGAPGEPHSLAELGRAVHCSPFHLARQFRRMTGFSMHAYQLSLRMAIALDRLQEGAEDLSGLAHDLGFSSHSHFSARFRQAFGAEPQCVRAALTRRRAEELRRILTATPLRER